MMTSDTSQAIWPGPDNGGWAGPDLHLSGWTDEAASRSSVRRTLYCYAQGAISRTLRDLLEVRQAALAAAIERCYDLGTLFVEEDSSGRAMHALVDAASLDAGKAAVAVPHRGHLIPLGAPREWQQFLEELTGHPLVFTSRTH